jgi:hypothetical protein
LTIATGAEVSTTNLKDAAALIIVRGRARQDDLPLKKI